MKLTTRCGSTVVDGLNEALLAKAVEAKVLRTSKIRVDTTVVPANVAYPTDSGLLAKAANRIAATGRRIRAAGGTVPVEEDSLIVPLVKAKRILEVLRAPHDRASMLGPPGRQSSGIRGAQR